MSTNHEDDYVAQWVSEVVEYSSQYDSVHWGADKIIGTPVVYPRYGDIFGAWAQGIRDENQYIVIKYEESVYLKHLNIYETYNCGAIVRIKAKNQVTNEWFTVWESENEQANFVNRQESRIFKPPLIRFPFKTDTIRIEMDCQSKWCEIDAVEMLGEKFHIDKSNTEKTLKMNLLTLLDTEEFSDVQFEVEGRIVKGHRNIFAARSTFFKNILSESVKTDKITKPVHIDNISYEAFKCLMHYLYSGGLEENTNCVTVCELIRVSEWYDLDKLDDVGYLFIKENLCHDNVLMTLVSATQTEPQLIRVEKACLKYMARNFHTILNNPDFKNLDKKIVVKIAQFYGQFFEKQE